jgi:hypothetical protein
MVAAVELAVETMVAHQQVLVPMVVEMERRFLMVLLCQVETV